MGAEIGDTQLPRPVPAWHPSATLLGVLALVVAVFAAYWPALSAGFIWDDDIWLTANDALATPEGLLRIWALGSPSQYFPLVYTSFFVERQIWQLDPFGYHLTNVVLHTLNALLVWRVLLRLELRGAWLAAMLFALHPVHVESVAWITERKNVLCLFFSLLSVLGWLRFIELPPAAGPQRPRSYVFSLATYALALLSKTTACTLPAALVLSLWIKREKLTRQRWLAIAPYVGLGLAMGLLTVWYEGTRIGTWETSIDLSAADRLLIASRAIWFYLGKLAWPSDLAFVYPHWQIDPSDPRQYVWLLACLLSLGALAYWREALGRGPAAALVFYVATLSPLLGFFSLYTFQYTYVMDHYQYVASIGPIALAAGGFHLALDRLPDSWRRPVGCAIALALIAGLGSLTWRQSHAYESVETIWLDTLAKNPECWMAHNNLGAELRVQGRSTEAIEHLSRAIEIKPDHHMAINNLAMSEMQLGQWDLATTHMQRALELQPESVEYHNNFGALLTRRGHTAEAIPHLRFVVDRRPSYRQGVWNLAQALEATGQHEEAEKLLKRYWDDSQHRWQQQDRTR